jgi:hypothetical protein
LFGANGDASSTALRTHFVMNRPAPLAIPELNSKSRYWDTTLNVFSGGSVSISGTAKDEVTVTGVDASTSTIQRTRTSDGRVDSYQVNYPVEGMRYRAASGTQSSLYMFMITGLGISAYFDNNPTSHFYGIIVSRP